MLPLLMVSNAKKRPVPSTECIPEKPKATKSSMLSFADELEAEGGDAAFSLADTTRKRCLCNSPRATLTMAEGDAGSRSRELHGCRFETERPLMLSPSAASPSPSHSYFHEYATVAADGIQKPTLGLLSHGASHARGQSHMFWPCKVLYDVVQSNPLSLPAFASGARPYMEDRQDDDGSTSVLWGCKSSTAIMQQLITSPVVWNRHTIIADYQLPSSGSGHANDGVLRSFAAVYDGHNGAEAAEQACSRYPSALSTSACCTILRR